MLVSGSDQPNKEASRFSAGRFTSRKTTRDNFKVVFKGTGVVNNRNIYRTSENFTTRLFKTIGKKDNTIFVMCVLAGLPPLLFLVGMIVPQLSAFSCPILFDICRFLFFFLVLPIFLIVNNRKTVTLPLNIPANFNPFHEKCAAFDGVPQAGGFFIIL